MTNINLCIPVLNRYDTLAVCIESALRGNVPPTAIYIIDNGGKFEAKPEWKNMFFVRPPFNIGVAKSWNLFLTQVPEIRIITNDDVEFYPDSIEKLVAGYDENFVVYPSGFESANSFSCYIMPDKIRDAVGLFDEEISPNYAYYEDNDYHRRMLKLGYTIKGIDSCNIKHFGSATLKRFSVAETQNHHSRFRYAQKKYIEKWGGLPGHEKFEEPYNKVKA